MSRKSTAIWIVGAVVVVGAGIGVAAVAATHPSAEAAATSSSTPVSTPTTSSAPSATATPTVSSTPPASAAPTSGASTGTTSAPSTGGSTGATTPASTVKSVTPSMSYYSFSGSTLTLGGGVSGLVDSGGTCLVTVTDGSATVTQSFAASAGPSSTDCGAMAITSAKFTPGDWTVTIRYSSPHAKGVSGPASVTL